MSKQGEYTGKGRDITGRRFGRLTAIAPAGYSSSWVEMWLCKCDCGRDYVAYKNHLMSGRTRSCGCLRADIMRINNKKRYETAMGFTKNTGEKRGKVFTREVGEPVPHGTVDATE